MKKSLVSLTLAFTALGVLLLTGCTRHQPRSPASLAVSSASIYAAGIKEKKQLSYDYSVWMNNTDKPSAMVTLKNLGNQRLDLMNIELEDPTDEKLFTLSSLCEDSIAPNGECKLHLSFKGKSKGLYTSTITIISNSQGKIGEVGRIAIIAEAKNLLTAVISPTKLSKNIINDKQAMQKFMFQKQGETKYAKLENNGLSDISISGIKLIGTKQFTYTSDCPSILKPTDKCELSFTYKKKSSKLALGYIVVKSDGEIFPSDTIRLRGKPLAIVADKNAPEILKLAAKDDMSISLYDVNVTSNIETFLEDSSNVKSSFYFRTMYQDATDAKFKEFYEHIISYYFRKNGYTLARSARNADKIINIYPKIVIEKDKDGSIHIKSNIKGNIVTKSSKSLDNSQNFEFNMSQTATGYSDDYFAYAGVGNNLTAFMFNLLGLED